MTVATAGSTGAARTGAAKASADQDAAAFRFVQSLAQELSTGKIDLPSFPDIVIRVRQVLADEDVKPEQIVRIVSTEPALAARLLHIANSAALNFSGKQISDLRTAITRMGFNMVRSAAIAFALWQLKKAETLKGLEKPLEELWQSSISVAAMSHVVARRLSPVNPDTALLAGLLHEIGKLYLLTRAHHHPDLLADPITYGTIVRDWHSSIAKALLENWQMPEEIVAAVSDCEDLERQHSGPADLTDVLTLAHLLIACREHPEAIELNLQGVAAVKRLRLAPDAYAQLLQESAEEFAAMRQALGHG
jgi:HD-like signal output (HDOD) protein